MKLQDFLNKHDLIEIKEEDGFILDLRYATPDNFLGEVLYDDKICLIKRNTANNTHYYPAYPPALAPIFHYILNTSAYYIHIFYFLP